MLKRFAITLFLALLSFGVCAFAQENQSMGQQPNAAGRPERRGGGWANPTEQTQRLTKELNLTADQQTKVQSILEDQQKQMQTLRQDTSAAPEDRRAKFMEMHKNTMSQIRGVLNEDQQKKFDEMQQKREQEMGGGHHKGDEQPKSDQK